MFYLTIRPVYHTSCVFTRVLSVKLTKMRILGIETSCDETSAAVVELIDAAIQPTEADTALGASEQRTEPYMKYGEGVEELGTTRSTASTSSVIGSAEQQAGAICRLLSNVVASSVNLHTKYGGGVPPNPPPPPI